MKEMELYLQSMPLKVTLHSNSFMNQRRSHVLMDVNSRENAGIFLLMSSSLTQMVRLSS